MSLGGECQGLMSRGSPRLMWVQRGLIFWGGYTTIWPIPWCIWCNPLPLEQTLWKHYIPANVFAGGEKIPKLGQVSPHRFIYYASNTLRRSAKIAKCILNFYRPQFLPHPGKPPPTPGWTPPGRYPPPNACWNTHPTPPPAETTGYCQQAGGMHPPGMHSCSTCYFWNILPHQL